MWLGKKKNKKHDLGVMTHDLTRDLGGAEAFVLDKCGMNLNSALSVHFSLLYLHALNMSVCLSLIAQSDSACVFLCHDKLTQPKGSTKH